MKKWLCPECEGEKTVSITAVDVNGIHKVIKVDCSTCSGEGMVE